MPPYEKITQLQYQGHYPPGERSISVWCDDLHADIFNLNSWDYDTGTAIYILDEPRKKKVGDKFYKIAPAVVFARSHWASRTGYLILDKTLTQVQTLKKGDVIKKNNVYYQIIQFLHLSNKLGIEIKSLINDTIETLISKKMRKIATYDINKIKESVQKQKEAYEQSLKNMKTEINLKNAQKAIVPRRVLGYQTKFVARGEI